MCLFACCGFGGLELWDFLLVKYEMIVPDSRHLCWPEFEISCYDGIVLSAQKIVRVCQMVCEVSPFQFVECVADDQRRFSLNHHTPVCPLVILPPSRCKIARNDRSKCRCVILLSAKLWLWDSKHQFDWSDWVYIFDDEVFASLFSHEQWKILWGYKSWSGPDFVRSKCPSIHWSDCVAFVRQALTQSGQTVFSSLFSDGYQPDTLKFKGTDVITTKWWKDLRSQGKDPKMWTQWYMT